jgi:hypothetical protein
MAVKPRARANGNTCRSRAGSSGRRNDAVAAADRKVSGAPGEVCGAADPPGQMARTRPQNAGKLCTDRKDEPVDNGVGGELSATLAGDPFIKGRKLTRLGQAEKPWVSVVDSESWWEHRPGRRSIASGIATAAYPAPCREAGHKRLG